jgi:hypothetical protein
MHFADLSSQNAKWPDTQQSCIPLPGPVAPVGSSGTPPASTCSNTVSDVNNCGECGYKVRRGFGMSLEQKSFNCFLQCDPGQQCIQSACKSPPDATTPNTFSPRFEPGAGTSPKGGWTFTGDPYYQYWENDITLPAEDYLVYQGRRTVNTQCMSVLLTGGDSTIPGDGSVLPAHSNILFETRIDTPGLEPDYCCVAYFKNSACKLVRGEYRASCTGFNGPSPIDIRSWQVYNCTGRYHISGQPDPGCVGECS